MAATDYNTKHIRFTTASLPCSFREFPFEKRTAHRSTPTFFNTKLKGDGGSVQEEIASNVFRPIRAIYHTFLVTFGSTGWMHPRRTPADADRAFVLQFRKIQLRDTSNLHFKNLRAETSGRCRGRETANSGRRCRCRRGSNRGEWTLAATNRFRCAPVPRNERCDDRRSPNAGESAGRRAPPMSPTPAPAAATRAADAPRGKNISTSRDFVFFSPMIGLNSTARSG